MKRFGRVARINVKVVVILAAVVAILFGGAAVAYKARKRIVADRALAAGLEAFETRNWSTAAQELRTYLEKYPDDAENLVKYARAELNVRPTGPSHLGRAMGAYRRYLRLRSDDWDARARLAELHLSVGNAADSIAIIHAGLLDDGRRIAPDHAGANLVLAQALIVREESRQACEVLEALITRHPECVEAYALRARLAAQLVARTSSGDTRPAVGGAGTTTSESRPSSTPAEAMKQWLDKALERNPDSAEALVLHAQWHRMRPADSADDWAKARGRAAEMLQAAEKMPRASVEALITLGREWSELRRFDAAEAALAKAETLAEKADRQGDPTDALVSVYRAIGAVKLRRADPEGAGELVDRAKKTLGDNWATFLPSTPDMNPRPEPGAVELYAAANRPDDAETLLAELQQSGFAAEQVPVLRARILLSRGEASRACMELEKVVARAAGSRRARLLLGRAYMLAGRPREAIAPLEELVKLRPDWLDACTELGQALAAQQQWTRAAEAFRQALQISLDTGVALMWRECEVNAALQSGDQNAMDAIAKKLEAIGRSLPGVVNIPLLRARIASKRGQMDLAIEILTEATKCDAPLPAKMRLGELYAARGQFDRAISTCEAAIRDHSDFPGPPILLAKTLMAEALGRPAEARKEAMREAEEKACAVLERAMGNLTGARRGPVSMELAKLLTDRGEVARASEILAALARELDPTRAASKKIELALLRVRVARASKDTAAANELTRELRALEGESGFHWRLERARTLWQEYVAGEGHSAERADEIEKTLRECIRIDSTQRAPVSLLAGLLQSRNRLEDAIDEYRQYMKVASPAVEMADELIAMLERLGRTEEIEDVLGGLPKGHPRVEFHKIRRDVLAGRFGRAEERLLTRLAADPQKQDLAGRLLLARLCVRRGDSARNDLGRADELLAEAQKAAPDDLRVTGSLVDLRLIQKKTDQALQIAEEAVRRLGSFDAHFLLAGTRERVSPGGADEQRRKAALADAEREYRSLTQIAGSEARGWAALAAFYARHERLDDGCAAWESGLRAVSDLPPPPGAAQGRRRQANINMLKRGLVEALLSTPGSGQEAKRKRKRGDEILATLIQLPRYERDAGLRVHQARRLLAAKGEAGWDEAAAILEMAIKSGPGSEAAHELLAKIALRRGDATEAQRMVDRGLAAHPDNGGLTMLKVELLLAPPRDPVRAASLAEKLVTRDPRNRPAVELWARALRGGGRKEKAREVIRDFVDRMSLDLTSSRPNRPTPIDDDALKQLLLTARALLSTDSALAADIARRAAKADPTNEDAHLIWASGLKGAGRTSDAIELLDKFLDTTSPRPLQSVLLLGQLHCDEKHYDRTDALVAEARGLAEDNDSRPLRLDLVARGAQGKFDEVIKLAREHHQNHPEDRLVVLAAAQLLIASGQDAFITAGGEMLDRLPRTDPLWAPGMYTLAQVRYTRNEMQEAEKTLRSILEAAPRFAAALNDLAWLVSEHRGDHAEALELADRGLAIYPNVVHLLDTRGVILYRIGMAIHEQYPPLAEKRLRAAERDLRRCVALCAGDEKKRDSEVSGRFHLARVLAKLGDRVGAREAITEARELLDSGAPMSEGETKEMKELARELYGQSPAGTEEP